MHNLFNLETLYHLLESKKFDNHQSLLALIKISWSRQIISWRVNNLSKATVNHLLPIIETFTNFEDEFIILILPQLCS